MLGGYPRLVTEARMTSRIVRCRCVSPESPDRALRSGSPPGESLSLIRTNVARSSLDIKHVFEACRHFYPRRGAESCRWGGLSSAACATVRSHVRNSNTLSIMLRTSDRHQPSGGTHMMPIETISPSAPIRCRPVQVRPVGHRGRPGSRGPQPSRPVAARPRYRGTGVLMSTAPHRPRPIRPATTVGLALLAALITVWLGLVAHF